VALFDVMLKFLTGHILCNNSKVLFWKTLFLIHLNRVISPIYKSWVLIM